MTAPQWRPNYFCLLSFQQIMFSSVGPAVAFEQVTSPKDLIETGSLI